ncbi:hypothetical protein BDD14_4481 [Edaphobacter modestus]|uniref:Uncharacterized protein n=1 Tax=Edaphobacter modestus TaxID=388466 RepID=A0A4Q7Z063_9BACT|nr:hypothetical protein BDD14_4481 [Edaphobacter modestus]
MGKVVFRCNYGATDFAPVYPKRDWGTTRRGETKSQSCSNFARSLFQLHSKDGTPTRITSRMKGMDLGVLLCFGFAGKAKLAGGSLGAKSLGQMHGRS